MFGLFSSTYPEGISAYGLSKFCSTLGNAYPTPPKGMSAYGWPKASSTIGNVHPTHSGNPDGALAAGQLVSLKRKGFNMSVLEPVLLGWMMLLKNALRSARPSNHLENSVDLATIHLTEICRLIFF